ncbi:MAG: FtsX-like permease family protein, partial [Cyclobacteriaceae bacterium]
AMAVVAIFLIVTACINFVNLSTAVAVKRSKEVGIRKVLGGQRFQLISQYLAETSLITLVALLLAIGFAELTLINLNSFLNLNLHVDFGNQGLFIFIASVWLIVTIISGLYPALLLSGFSPARALKNKITNRGTGGFVLRRGLVVFQFVISQLLIVGTIILLSQMNYIENKNLGFVKDAIIRVPIPANAPLNNQKVLKTNLSQINGVERVSLCSRLPASGAVWSSTFRVEGVDGDFMTQVKLADENYLKLFDIQLLAGNDLPDLDTATTCVVNEKLALTAGFNSGEEMVGSQIRLWGKTMPVVGVVKDFHTVSLAEEIDPTIIFNRLDRYKEIAIKLNRAAINKQTL